MCNRSSAMQTSTSSTVSRSGLEEFMMRGYCASRHSLTRSRAATSHWVGSSSATVGTCCAIGSWRRFQSSEHRKTRHTTRHCVAPGLQSSAASVCWNVAGTAFTQSWGCHRRERARSSVLVSSCTTGLYSCAGQNKNFKMLCFFQYLIPTGRFREIEHKFPAPGHTYLDSDRDFVKIEVAVKKRENIFTVDEYHAIIIGAFNKPKASVTRMADKLIDVSNLDKTLHIAKKMYNTAGEKIEMRDRVRWIKMSEFGRYWYRHSLKRSAQVQ